MRSATPIPDTEPGAFSSCSDDELLRRLGSLTSEYDGFIRIVTATTVKAVHVRNEISEVLREIERRNAA